MYNKFYKKTPEQRRLILTEQGHYNATLDTPLSEDVYANMIENAITTYEIPLGVVPEFIVNEKSYCLALATEEPSVIAALSNANKIMSQNGGITAKVESRLMRGQIAFANPVSPEDMEAYVTTHSALLIDICNEAYPSIVNRGGGVVSVTSRFISKEGKTPFFIVYASVDTQEAMGANMMNTMLEALAKHLGNTFNEEPLMSILSNLATDCIVNATVTIEPKTLKFSETIAKRIEQASHLAEVDPYRATTHNKGIMNGIDALVIASGNDWRAIEAAVHAYASLSGTYQPLATWRVVDDNLVGSMRLPMPIGSVGGSIAIHPKAQLTKQMIGYKSAKELMMLLAAVGLAQNFAAIYALTTDGIQKGHMALHARSLALSAHAPLEHLDAIVELLKQQDKMNLEVAKEIIETFKEEQ